MKFTSDSLNYKAYTFKGRSRPLEISTQSIKLVKAADGYNVPADKILVKVHSAGLNPVDYSIYQSSSFPLSLWEHGIGFDYSGTVVAIGELGANNAANNATPDFKVGDKVNGFYPHPFGKGTLAEYVLLDTSTNIDSGVAKIPTNLTMNEAAAWPTVLGTSFLVTSGLDLKDKKVLVLGAATSVGRFVVSQSKDGGAREIVTTNSEKSSSVVQQLGGTSFIDYTKHKSILEPALESVKNTGKFDYVFDCCGSNDLLKHTSTILADEYVTVVGDYQRSYRDVTFFSSILPMIRFLFRQFWSSLGYLGYKYRFIAFLSMGPKADWIKPATKLIEEERVKVFVDSVYKFQDLDKAIERVNTNQAKGKVVVQVEE